MIQALSHMHDPCDGQVEPGEYKVFGHGNQSCGSWTEAKEKDTYSRDSFHSWVNGYLTAYSAWVEVDHLGPVTNTQNTGAWAWIDNYCLETPLSSVADAAQELIFAIRAK